MYMYLYTTIVSVEMVSLNYMYMYSDYTLYSGTLIAFFLIFSNMFMLYLYPSLFGVVNNNIRTTHTLFLIFLFYFFYFCFSTIFEQALDSFILFMSKSCIFIIFVLRKIDHLCFNFFKFTFQLQLRCSWSYI